MIASMETSRSFPREWPFVFSDEVGFTLHNQISRRNFVAGAATVGAMAAFGMAGCSSKGSGKAESKAEEYDIVIVGAGGAGHVCCHRGA